MRFAATILAAVLIAGTSCFAADPPATAPVAASQPSALEAIKHAPTPSYAIDAYARANAPDDVALQQAFVRKMVDFGLPDIGDTQADKLTKSKPDFALAWAVVGYVSAARGDSETAISNLRSAVDKDQDDPFILRTAGQVVAWYDAQPDKSKLAGVTKDNVDAIRMRVNNYAIFSDAYKAASRDLQASAATQPGQEAPPPAGPSVVDYPPASSGGSYSSAPPATYVNYYDTYTNPYWYDPYWYGGFWAGSVFIIHDHGHHHDHDDHHHDGDHHDGDHHWSGGSHGGMDGSPGHNWGGSDGSSSWSSASARPGSATPSRTSAGTMGPQPSDRFSVPSHRGVMGPEQDTRSRSSASVDSSRSSSSAGRGSSASSGGSSSSSGRGSSSSGGSSSGRGSSSSSGSSSSGGGHSSSSGGGSSGGHSSSSGGGGAWGSAKAFK